ncbi:hypothetical protein Pmani_027211 [Petrolisthes manimaculis]|uniref:Neural-cadherin n=1 Tax=Petrolisthes manimaculis TaxID=1843537 RepID=A0AAE1P3J0_9EUCA|nr:hypothetical protein Pmani_027211 [Petrolisthes manimaculis]
MLSEDAALASTLVTVSATHSKGAGIRYSITGGNRDGLFTIHQHTGVITLAAPLDYETHTKHDLVVAGEGGGQVGHTLVQVKVADVNDNPPYFIHPLPEVTLVEEEDAHLPAVIATVEAKDRDYLDHHGLLYTVRGDGVDGYHPTTAFFTINSLTGELTQLKALDRDPPKGKVVWKVKVQVRDGQALWSRQAMHRHLANKAKALNATRKAHPTTTPMKRSITVNTRTTHTTVTTTLSQNMETKLEHSTKTTHPLTTKKRIQTRDAKRMQHNNKRATQLTTTTSKRTQTQNTKTTTITTHPRRRRIEPRDDDANEITLTNSADTKHSYHDSRTVLYTTNTRKARHTLGKQQQEQRRVIHSSTNNNNNNNNNNSSSTLLYGLVREHGVVRIKVLQSSRKYRGGVKRHHARTKVFMPASGVGVKRRGSQTLHGTKTLSPPPDRTKTRVKRSPQNYQKMNLWDEEDEAEGEEEEGQNGQCEIDRKYPMGQQKEDKDKDRGRGGLHGLGGSRVHVAETEVTIRLLDRNDNSPVFPNATMFGLVQENGPIDLSVTSVAAWDADDAFEGTNAKVTYSILRNARHERTGEAIFSIHPHTGLIRTAVCCLDRETTTQYQIQVVATDGGGLQGTGVVVVRLADVNDNSPKLEQKLWQVEVDETWGNGPPDDTSLLQISVLDPDTSNYFYYRVVESSGWGWQHFGLRSVGASGHLYARQTLDYENESHRRGFKFMVQVTDKGRGGWEDPRHLDSAWVVVNLRDLNDNPPQFIRPQAHVTLSEDAAPGTSLATLTALEPDESGQQEVEYQVEGFWNALTVDYRGTVSLQSAVDREAGDGGGVGEARILCVDSGQPPLTATATLTITLTDINDTPPTLLPPTTFHVTEHAAPAHLGVITATDDDVWALGHGPPFTFSLSASNHQHILDYIALEFDPQLDSGRGGANLRTVASVDREQYSELEVAVSVTDAGGLAATHIVTVIIDDINDNPMEPGAKTVYLWKPQGGATEAPLGRVFVKDPDDWDLDDKMFSWVGPSHPLFTLNPHTGDILASSQVKEGRYELHVSVSDQVWGQSDVRANVTVVVQVLPPDALTHAVPLTLTPTTPHHLTSGWTPQSGGGGLGRVVEAVKRVVRIGTSNEVEVEVMSVQGPTFTTSPAYTAAVWVSVREETTHYMDPVKLRGLLALYATQVEAMTNLTVATEVVRTGWSEHHYPASNLLDPPSAASQPSTSLPLQVVDTNSTSLVTPLLTHAHNCHTYDHHTCTPTSCLNGGRCVARSRCVCPGGSWGPQCKILGRTFTGADWAWVRPLPQCLPTTISLRVLTRRPYALVLFSGPLAPLPRHSQDPPTPMLALQLWRGRPQVLVEGGGGTLKLEVPTAVNDGDWHTLHLRLSTQGVVLVVDLCGGRHNNNTKNDGHCTARASWANPRGMAPWPLQVGGLAHTLPNPSQYGWKEAPTPQPLDGCVSHLRLNGQLVDLGQPAYIRGGQAGCQTQEAACVGGCGHRGECVGGLEQPECHCEAGWEGPDCATPTPSVALISSTSYIKMSLAFTPQSPQVVTAQLRVRTRGTTTRILLHLSSLHQVAAFTIHLRAGVACVTVTGEGVARNTACVEGRPLGDGDWHTITAERHGPNLLVEVDDGDGWRRNESLTSLVTPGKEDHLREPYLPLHLDTEDGITVGAVPELLKESLVDVLDDLQDVCVEDVRVWGRPLPLPPAANTTRWGHVTSWQGLEADCSDGDACLNTTCVAPFTCFSTWRATTCSCGSGRQLVGRSCQDVDECLWGPCLHGGSCYNLRPGFQCVCGPGHIGDHCQWPDLTSTVHPLTAPLAITAFTLSIIIFVVAGVVISLRLRQKWFTRGEGGQQCSLKEGHEGGQELQGDEHHQALLQRLKFTTTQTHTNSQEDSAGEMREKNKSKEVKLAAEVMAVAQGGTVTWPQPLPATDDLRAYTYEGEGSFAGSLTSALSDMKEDQEGEGSIQVTPGFLEVMDLLKNLPEATKSPALQSKFMAAEAVPNVK